jgi:hypothetical protein
VVQSLFWGDSPSVDLGYLSVFEASDSSLPGNVMASGRLFQPDRSVFLLHMGSDVLLKMAIKNCVSSSGKRSASSCAPAGGGEEDRKFTRI